jgi:hypothetical protein
MTNQNTRTAKPYTASAIAAPLSTRDDPSSRVSCYRLLGRLVLKEVD